MLFPISILLMVIGQSETAIMQILLFSIVVFISLWLISFFVEDAPKGNSNSKNINFSKVQSDNISNDIAETCTHCKNPNTKRIRTCEWCGSQIV